VQLPHTVVANHVRSSRFKSKKDGQAHGQSKGPVPGFQLGTESNGFDLPHCGAIAIASSVSISFQPAIARDVGGSSNGCGALAARHASHLQAPEGTWFSHEKTPNSVEHVENAKSNWTKI